MKSKLILLLLLCTMVAPVKLAAQSVTESDIENYKGDELVFKDDGTGIDYVKSALKIKDLYGLDRNNAITRTVIIDAPGKTKGQIYVEVNNWFARSFNDGKSVIQLNEKEEGTIIGKGYIREVATHMSFASNAYVHAWVIIRVDIKDEKFRVMTTISSYEIDLGNGVLGSLNGRPSTNQKKKWVPDECFPFTDKAYKKTTSKAFVNCHIWSQIIIDKLADVVLNGATGTEEEW